MSSDRRLPHDAVRRIDAMQEPAVLRVRCRSKKGRR